MNCRGLVERGPRSRALGLAAVALGGVLLAPGLRADDAAGTARAVRLSYVEGQVRIAQGGQVLADPALVNTPLFEGTEVTTSQDGRAELQFDDGSVARLSPNSSLILATLSGQGGSGDTGITLESGLGYFELHGEGTAGHITVRFGDSAVTASGLTVVRINLDTPPGELAVFSGNANLERNPSVAVALHGGESVTLNATDPNQYSLVEWIEPDSWDTWNSDRDQAMMSAEAARTGAANSMPDKNNPAWNDLDANGNWYNVPDQGYVWSPNDAASPGWDPYGNGDWMWTPNFGYIFVSGNSWGYMPYQCGAWNYFNDFGWGWVPGGGEPWWGGGLWAFNIGHRPASYRLPLRPRPGLPNGPIVRPGNGGPANPVVAVNRHFAGGIAAMPARERNGIVTISGHTVEPMRSTSPRPLYDGVISGNTGRSQTAHLGAGMLGTPGQAQGYSTGGSRSGYEPAVRPSEPGVRSSAPGFRPSNGGQRAPSASRPAPTPSRSGPAAHISSGGGGHAGGGGGHR